MHLFSDCICGTYESKEKMGVHARSTTVVLEFRMSVAVPIPALASVSVLQSAAVGGSVVGVVGPL